MNPDPTATLPPPAHVPLARDSEGHSIPLPEDAAAWRIRRHTGGRPRHHLDGHKQPMLFPLHYSIVDAEDILPPGTYRLDLIDANGEHLDDITVPITIGSLRNAVEPARDDDDESPTSVAVSSKLPVSGSDVRLVLEANIRATQLAFQHNERTLAASLRMAETLRDGVQVLAESQADWIKSVAASRGFLRNTAPPAPQLMAPPARESNDDDNDDEDDAPQSDDRLVEFGIAAMTLVNNLVESFRGGGKSSSVPRKTGGFDLRSLLDWRRAAPACEPQPPNAPEPASSPADIIAASLPPEFLTKLQAVRERLTDDEQSRLMPFVMAIDPEQLPAIAAELMAKSVDEIANIFRAELAKLEKR